MNLVEFIAELDKRIELVQNTWTDDLVVLLANDKIPEGSARYTREYNKLAKKYAPIVAELLEIRKEAYNKQANLENKEYEERFVEVKKEDDSPVDANGRPKGKMWKNGQWVEYKKKSVE